ncbi:MAG: DUF4132 domain-containing protein [Chloroflexi bacterium]|nr:MAG: DUF4132 domain-containing protein [Chloroflexota bacterium]MBL1193856.1 DUF4132 domain-containing protein [Chloroflexota bacterium]NOH11150.1 DUF4132 domain-containing protein [Chloroflexota bacterium]
MYRNPRHQLELEPFQVEDWQAQRQASIKALPRKVKKLAQHLLDGLVNGPLGSFHHTDEQRQITERFFAALEELPNLSSREREQLFTAFYPKIAKYLEYAWQLHAQLPVQRRYLRKAFRAPNRPDLIAPMQTTWFRSVLMGLVGFDPDLPWLAAWAHVIFPHFGGSHAGVLMAAAINSGDEVGEEVLDILLAAAMGEHDQAVLGRHAITALLLCERSEAWEMVENLLRAAQRQEGLRQVILETVDFAHPEAFLRLIRLILEERLVRFSSVVRAVDVWFGLAWDSANPKQIETTLRQVLTLFEDEQAHAEGLLSDDAETRFLALWVTAFHNAPEAIQPAAELLEHDSLEMRFIGAHFLSLLNLLESQSHLVQALRDEDLNVVVTALIGLNTWSYFGAPPGMLPDLFETLEAVLPRLPKEVKRKALVWPWMELRIKRQDIAAMLVKTLGKRSPLQLLPLMEYFEPRQRAGLAEMLSEHDGDILKVRGPLLELAADRSPEVRRHAFNGLSSMPLWDEEIAILEDMLRRKPADLRSRVLQILSSPQGRALKSARRLLASPHRLQRLAGLELLRRLQYSKYGEKAQELIEAYRARKGGLSREEERLLVAPKPQKKVEASLTNGLGLFDPDERTRPMKPKKQAHLLKAGAGKSLIRPAVQELWTSLDQFVHENREEPVEFMAWRSERRELLGNIRYGFPMPSRGSEASSQLPLHERLVEWWDAESQGLVGQDRLVLLQAVAAGGRRANFGKSPGKQTPWIDKLERELFGDLDLRSIRFPQVVRGYLHWLLHLHPIEAAPDYLLDAVEHGFASIPEKELRRTHSTRNTSRGIVRDQWSWRQLHNLLGWLRLAQTHRQSAPELWLPAHDVRLYQSLRWFDEPHDDMEYPRQLPDFTIALAAYEAGGATKADLYEHIFQSQRHQVLRTISGYEPSHLHKAHPVLDKIVANIRERVVSIELQRGDLSTIASSLAISLRYTGGMQVLLGLLAAMVHGEFARGHTYDYSNKDVMFSHMIRATRPESDDTPAAFAAAARASEIPKKRLIQLAVFAPQWAAHVQEALGWDGLVEGVWWLYAHTKDNQWRVDQEIQEQWAAQISERTALSAQDLIDGAVDVAWFQRVMASLGPKRWQALSQADKLASSGRGHTRARLFADAMLGKLEMEKLIWRLTKKRYQDAARALGLIPLLEGEQQQEELLSRYQILQEFKRTGNKVGVQRRTSEKLAVRIGLENLARTAGYADPARLQWAMEAEEVADLAEGCVEAKAGDITLRLEVTAWGDTELTIEKENGKRLKRVPPRIKKEPQIVKVLELQKVVKKQASRMRQSLEEAMIRGDSFEGRSLFDLLAHPLLGVMLSQLVFIGEKAIGFPIGKSLEHHDGSKSRIKVNDKCRIAHPLELLEAGEWHAWQKACFQQERIQPFKQVFREVYVLTEGEKRDAKTSQRYVGHQVNPRQAVGILGSRLWVPRHEVGVSRTFHDEGIVAYLEFLNTWGTPADVEGSTVEGVSFAHRDEIGLMNLEEVPKQIFSEVMRDVDLVVSVAHRGGVDPEASHSTVEMRTALLRETLPWVKINNVALKDNWALIEGQRSNYNVHLGSGVVHMQPGGALCIIPVHAQHRGRLFLPFADDDPRTAEVISKVLLLAKDDEIKDPTILEQIV